MSNEKILEEVTSNTLKEVTTQDIVLPENYAQTFKKYLVEKNLFEDYNSVEISQELSTATLDKAQNLMDKAQGALGSLDGYVQTAQQAIATKDENSLANVLCLVDSMKEEIKHLRGEVYIDNLTQIYNRKWIFDKLLDKEGNFLFSGSMAFLDLNNFKPINDKLGHDVGDRVLVYIGQMLQKIVLADKNTEETHVIRYAGDEFTLISEISKEALSKTLKNAYKKLHSKVFQSHNKKFSLSFSFGIADFEKGDDFIKVMKEADQAMYANKKALKEAEKSEALI